MKKTIRKIFAGILSGALLLSGCGSPNVPTQPNPTDTPQSVETAPVQTETIPVSVDENVFYFANELEYNRLYSQRMDGTDLKLLVDAYCYDVQQHGNSVYFMNRNDLCVYDIPSGNNQILIKDVFDYEIDGKDLVYFQDSDETYYSNMRYRNLETGEDMLLETTISGDFEISNRKLYYSTYSMDTFSTQLCVFDFEKSEKRILAGENDGFSYFYQLLASHDGVFFQSNTQTYETGYFFASADGSGVYQVDAGLTFDCSTFYHSEGTYCCISTVYDETQGSISSIHCHNSDGTVTDFLTAEGNGSFNIRSLNEEYWLVEQVSYSGWGAQDEYGIYENFAYRLDHVLMNTDGNITSLNVTGENGNMFADGDFPIIDSSTARKPVTAALYNLFVANYGYEGAQPLCSTTHGAWLNIADRKADIALLAAPTDEELAYLRERGVEVEMKLYGGDGLVFIGNTANPVTNLSHDQIISIYRGEITNWSEVGGPDQPINVYYRDDQSGSQRLFEKLVFKGLEIPDFYSLGFDIMDEMSTIVDIVLSDPYAIGYSIMTYLDEVYAQEELKVFAVNDVLPSPDTVKDATYPYHTQGYVVIRSDEPEGSPARRLYNWFGSAVCNDLLTDCSVTPLQDGVG